jgi:uncharacterized protein YkwD
LEYEPAPDAGSGGRRWGRVIAAVVIAAFLAIVVALLVLPSLVSISGFLGGGSASSSTFVVTPLGGGNSSYSSSGSSEIEISYPQNYAELANYSLDVINQDRANFGLSPVTLSPVPSAQEHADSMFQNDYFSHWDTQGYKPYMRYTILNGTGFVEENVAYESTTLPSFISTSTVESAISSLEWQMMYNDSVCCQNGHRDNILTSFHNRVSIGIAFDSNNIYFVEDFETYLTTLSTPIYQGNTVSLTGNTSGELDPNSVLIFYDSPPQPLTSAQLDTQYFGPYDQGTFLGGVVPPCTGIFTRCLQFAQGITEQASLWQVSSDYLNVQFSLASFIQKGGNGVYTVYLLQGSQQNPEYLTSISIFINSS